MTLSGDAGRLTQVFANLLLNAAKFTDRGGRIDILAEVEPDWVLVMVRDSGCGIPREMLARIFDAHVPASAPLGIAGEGLGLALVRHLVDLHGGAVSASGGGGGRAASSSYACRASRGLARDLATAT